MSQKSKYRLERADIDPLWDDFVDNTENGTVFSRSEILRACQGSAVYKIFRSNELRAGLVVCEDEDGTRVYNHDLIIYSGILFAAPSYAQNHAQIISERFAILEFVAQELPGLYQSVEISLDPSIVDIRPFLWYRYGQPAPHYLPDIRYTTVVDIHDFSRDKKLEEISLYEKASGSRRQEIRYGRKKEVRTDLCENPSQLIDFYRLTMGRQDIEVDERATSEMEALISNLMESGRGMMFVSKTKENSPGSMAFFGLDSTTAYYIFGANDPQLRNAHTGTAVLWDAFYHLAQSGIQRVDLEGVNSPHRGWFKLSFGGDIKPYFHLYYPETRTHF